METGILLISIFLVFNAKTRAICPAINGKTTVKHILNTILLPAVEDTFNIINNINGVVKIPIKLPNTLAQIAKGVDPPAARVNITADDTGGGNAATTSNPFTTNLSIPTIELITQYGDRCRDRFSP